MIKQTLAMFLLPLVLILVVAIVIAQGNNDFPNANDDRAVTNVGKAVTIDLVSNDTDIDGTINASSVSLITHTPRNVASLDGINDRISWGNLGLHGTTRITKLIRFKTTDTASVLFDWENNGGFDGGLAILGHLQLRCGFVTSGVKVVDIVPAAEAANGQWHSAGFTYDGSELKTYFDGQLAQTISISDDSIRHSYKSICGRRTISNARYFAGELADFVVYNQALTSEEINAYNNGFVRTQDLVLWGKMDEADYASGLADASGNDNNGTNMGASPIVDTLIVNPNPANKRNSDE